MIDGEEVPHHRQARGRKDHPHQEGCPNAATLHPVGFYTEEIREQGERVGFQLVSLDGQKRVMSHIEIQSPFRVGRYGVDVEGFERFLVSLPFTATSQVVIDEIGMMECLSKQFQRLVMAILDRDVTCTATIALRGTGFIESVKQRPDVTLFAIDTGNRDRLATVLLQAIQMTEERKGS